MNRRTAPAPARSRSTSCTRPRASAIRASRSRRSRSGAAWCHGHDRRGRRRPPFRHRVRARPRALHQSALRPEQNRDRAARPFLRATDPPGRGPGAGPESLDAESAPDHAATWRSCPTFPAPRSSAISRTRIAILIHERVPVVKIVGLNIDLGTRETFYLDRDCVVLKPREDETLPLLPEIIGLTNAELRAGHDSWTQTSARAARWKSSTRSTTAELHTSINIRTIDLSNPLSITMTTTQRHDRSPSASTTSTSNCSACSRSSRPTPTSSSARCAPSISRPTATCPVTFYE